MGREIGVGEPLECRLRLGLHCRCVSADLRLNDPKCCPWVRHETSGGKTRVRASALGEPYSPHGKGAGDGVCISVPITVSGDVAHRQVLQSQNDGQSSLTRDFGLSCVLGPHCFLYSNVEVRSSSYFTYETGSDNQPEVQFHAIQAFVG